MAKFEAGVRTLVKVELEQCRFDALVSFAYNCGIGNLKSSTLLRKVNRGDFAGAAREFGKWNKAGGRVLKGLTRRRAAEATLFQGAGCIEANAREDEPMAQAVDAPTDPGLVETTLNSKIGKTGLGLGLGDGAQTIDAIGDAAEKAQSARDAAESLGIWDIVTSALQSPRVLFGIAALVAIGLLIYWRHRDHS
jgi:lysozyme